MDIRGASQAMRVFNATLKTNPVGLFIGVITAAVSAYMLFNKATVDAKDESKEFNDILKTHIDSILSEKIELNSLVNEITSLNVKSELRKKLLKDLQEKYPDFLKNLNAEKVTNAQLAEALSQVNEGYAQKLKLAAIQAKGEVIQKNMLANETRRMEIEEKLAAFRSKAVTSGSKAEKEMKDLEKEYEQIGDKNIVLEQQLTDLTSKASAIKSEIGNGSLDYYKKRLEGAKYSISVTETSLKEATEKNFTDKIKFYTERLKQYTEQKKIIEEQIKNAELPVIKPSPKKEDAALAETKTTKYSLTDDIDYVNAKIKLNKKFADGEIASQRELEEKLLSLDMLFLKKAIASGKYQGEQLASLKSDLVDKEIKQKENDLKREKYFQDTIGTQSEIDKENQMFQDKLAEYWSYVKDKNNLTEEELKANLVLQETHQLKLDKIDAEAYVKKLDKYEAVVAEEVANLKVKHTEELNSITTFQQAKAFLSSTWNAKQLSKLKTFDQAKKAIEKQQANEEMILQQTLLKDLLHIVETSKKSGSMEGVSLSDGVISEDELKVLNDRITKLKEAISKAKLLIHELYLEDEAGKRKDRADAFHDSEKKDILGFSGDDWTALFDNLKAGKIGINEMVLMVNTLKNAWSEYNNYLSAAENKKSRDMEEGNNKEKTALKTKLDKHLITQTAYDLKVKALDDNLQKQKDTATYNQALRDARLNEVNAIQSAAVASIAIWKYGPAVAIPMEILIAATLAASLATIEANMPSPPAYAEGGFTNGDQIYRAGERGQEFIASNSLLRDSKTAPVIKWLDQYQRGGKSIPMPIEANFNGMQTAVSNKYSSSSSDGNNQILISMVDHQKATITELVLLNKYLSDPANRKARIVRDELTRFDGEMATLQSLAKIR